MGVHSLFRESLRSEHTDQHASVYTTQTRIVELWITT